MVNAAPPTQNSDRLPGRDVVLAVLISVIWGVNFVIAKAGLDQLPPILLVCIRFILVSAVLVPFVKRPTGHWRGIFWLAVTLGLLHFSFIFTGMTAVDAAVAAITVQSQVVFAAVLAAIIFKDPPGWRRLTGMAVSVAGVAVLVGAPTGSSETWAIAFIIVAALLFAVANIQMTKLNALDGLSMNGWVAMFAAPMLAVATLVLEDGQLAAMEAANWWIVAGVILYQAVIVVMFGYTCWHRLLGRHGVQTMMPFTLLVPLNGVVSGVVFRGEPLTWGLIVGGTLTIVGVAIIVVRRPKLAEQQVGQS